MSTIYLGIKDNKVVVLPALGMDFLAAEAVASFYSPIGDYLANANRLYNRGVLDGIKSCNLAETRAIMRKMVKDLTDNHFGEFEGKDPELSDYALTADMYGLTLEDLEWEGYK